MFVIVSDREGEQESSKKIAALLTWPESREKNVLALRALIFQWTSRFFYHLDLQSEIFTLL